MHIRVRIHTILVLLATALTTAAQNHANPNDTIIAAHDSTRTEERAEAAPMRKSNKIDAPIRYEAKDSCVLLGNGTAILHGSSNVKYEKMDLTADYIRCQMDSNTVFASGVYDTINEEWRGKPVFKDKEDKYESDEMTYNIKTKKGFIRNVTTTQGEGYIIADKTKKQDGDIMMMAGGKYTTCDEHEHPHFYLRMTKAKVKPGEYIATGPAYMVVGEVPVPLAIPFGFFPFTDKYSSGLIMPTFGDDYSRGLYLRGLGYYFAINDYMDLELTGDIYTKGTWAVYAKSRYVKRYKFSGSININYRTDITGEKGMPDYTKATNFQLQWTHQQDAKANPYSNFSASVNFSTSGYNRSNINSYYNSQLNAENTKSSSVSYTQRFPDSPWSISLSALVSQQTKDSTMTLTLPDLSVNMSTIYPFKRKEKVGKDKWYEKIKLSYSMNGKISVTNIKESELLHSNFLRDWKTGIKHHANLGASWTVFKYLNISPSIDMTDRMYFQRIDQHWNEDIQALQRDTSNGFYNVFDFTVGLTMSTKLYGMYTPSKKLFPKSKVEAFRHVFTPSIRFNYHPNFGKSGWGYYGNYDQPLYDGVDEETGMQLPRLDENGVPMFVRQNYSRFANSIYGTAPNGQVANLSFSFGNNIEMKLRNDKDTTGTEQFKVYSIIDALDITGGYNFAADSMNWNRFGVRLRLKLPVVNYTINLATEFDPYMYELNALGKPVQTNKQYWSNGKAPRWTGTNFSISYTFSRQVFEKWFKKASQNKNKGKGSEETDPNLGGESELSDMSMNADGTMNNAKLSNGKHKKNTEMDGDYVKTDIPWSITLGYSFNYREDHSNFDYDKMVYPFKPIQNLSISGNIGFGQGWKMSVSTYYDITNKKWSTTTFNISRDLHCWNMTASFVPFGPFKNYTFHIGVNASMLQDLKYDKTSTESTNKKVSWW
ncbi:MAG: LPS-assembly protein LptD [Paludibacteraceae bacterium]|nr:LPS-assembly protein LptD [Paludibacteraceae bacterium]